MLPATVFIVIFIGLISNADISLTRIDRNFILSSNKQDDCLNFSKEVDSLREWTEASTDKKCPPSRIQTVNKAAVQCFADVTDCLPEFVQKYQGQEVQKSGPNCWNSILVFSQILPGFRYSSPEEMNFYMNSPLCRSIENGEKKPGDIGIYRDKHEENEKSEVHAYIYISDRMSFSKRNPSYLNPYEIVSTSTDFKRAQEAELNSKKDRELDTQFFRCMSLDSYLKKNHSDISSTFQVALKQLQEQECLQHDFLIGRSSNNKAIIEVFAALGKLASDRLKDQDSNISEKEKFLWKSVYFRSFLGLEQMSARFLYRSPNIDNIPPYRDRKIREQSIKSNLLELISKDIFRLEEK